MRWAGWQGVMVGGGGGRRGGKGRAVTLLRGGGETIGWGGHRLNRLFMAASQSLYAVFTATQGAGPG